ncbi:5282_t:CDS:10 [Diversispora eburnea]|uniref:RING-type E3 ubiquitin transferase n=1 Tax=Diversispora eburnea TaxID=1213867 RepID=A0A9N8V0S1_9GLOM|nr:5282_t:CDS:10 [Diversispora eburnea]
MPDTIPIVLFFRRGLRRVNLFIRLWFRAILVGTVWLITLPYMTVWVWRFYFWSGETVAFSINGERPPTIEHDNNATIASGRSTLASFYASILKSTLWYAPPEAVELVEAYGDFTSKFFADTVEGMFITCAVVIVFVAAFLLREWIIQNTPPENNLEEDIIDAEENNEIIENNLRQIPPEEINVPNLEPARENQVGDFIFNNGNRLPLIMPPQPQPQPQRDANGMIIPTLIRDDRSLTEMLEQEERNLEPTPKFFRDEDSVMDLLKREVNDEKSLLNITDDEGSSSSHMPTPTLVRDTSLSSLIVEHKSDLNLEQELSDDISVSTFFKNFEDASSGFEDIGTSSQNNDLGDDSSKNSNGINEQSNIPKFIQSINNDESIEARDVELERDSSSLIVEFNEEESLDFEDDETGKTIGNQKSQRLLSDNGRYDEIPNISDSEDINIQEKYPRDLGDSYSPSKIITNNSGVYYDKFPLRKHGSASSLADLLDNSDEDELSDFGEDETDNYEDDVDDNDSDDSDNSDNENDRENAEAVEPEAPGVPALPALPAPLFNEAIDAPVADQAFVPLGEAEGEDEDNAANEDLEGVLEAIGMRGSLWMLAQNSALMSVLIALCLAGSIWVPYVVGKTVLLVKPLSLIQLPLTLLRRVTDPLVDTLLDTTLPWIWSIIFPVLKTGWNVAKPALLPLVEQPSLRIYLREITDRTQDLVFYSTSLMTEYTPYSTVNSLNFTTNEISRVQNITEFLKHHNLTVLVKVMERWDGFAYGNTPTDKIVCIICGYGMVILVCTWYLARTRNAYGRTVSRAVQEGLRQQGIVLKVAFFVAIELIIFPIICGILLDLSTLPLFNEATPTSRLEFYFDSPLTSTFLHWFTGTAFMFHFAVFVSLCRDIVRNGVMWFIRDPNDPQFHPIKEILERPVWTQLKKIGASGIMYSAMIVCGLGSVIYFIRYIFNGILPLQWSFSDTLSDFPIDLLIFHIIVPTTVAFARPKRMFRTLFENWWHITARHLRLTSFMFGDRHYEEEGTHVRKTWHAVLLNKKAPVPLPDDVGYLDEPDESEEVVFNRDGGFVRAPSYDGVPVVPGRRMLIPVTEHGALLNPEDATGDDEQDQLGYTIVYVPPNFKARVIMFLFCMWLSGSLFCCSVTVIPLLTGRYIFKSFIQPDRPVHDIYCFTIGIYIMWTLGVSFDWMIRKAQLILEKRNNNINWKVIRRKILNETIVVFKVTYLLVAFGVVIPFLLSLVVELYFLLPWKKPVTDVPIISYLQDWALGIIYLKIAYRVIFMLPDNTYSRAFLEITGRGIRLLNVKLATTAFIIPIGGTALTAIILPALTAMAIIFLTGIDDTVTMALIYRYIYPVFLAMVFGYRLQRHMTQLIRGWMQSVRDEEYLIGRRLHNIEQ